MDKFCIFRRMLDFMADYCNVTDADMNNYAGDIDISGTDDDGNTINIRVKIKQNEEAENNGN